MRIALVDSGIGLLSTAAALRRARPDADLVLSMDPDHMPWGPLRPAEITRRVVRGARVTLDTRPDAIVVACNTASVHALETLRAELEPAIPVVGTVPAIKPAADRGGPIAIWATPATTGSPYQERLIRRFAADTTVTPVACDGLADAVEAADPTGITSGIALATERTPDDVSGVVLGCTHYDLVSARITDALSPEVALYTAAGAVAAQTLRRIGVAARPAAPRTGTLTVFASGRPASLPPAARAYPAGALLCEPSLPVR